MKDVFLKQYLLNKSAEVNDYVKSYQELVIRQSFDTYYILQFYEACIIKEFFDDVLHDIFQILKCQ